MYSLALQAGYVGEDVESILYKLLVVCILTYVVPHVVAKNVPIKLSIDCDYEAFKSSS